jgi:hypothetical protein
MKLGTELTTMLIVFLMIYALETGITYRDINTLSDKVDG